MTIKTKVCLGRGLDSELIFEMRNKGNELYRNKQIRAPLLEHEGDPLQQTWIRTWVTREAAQEWIDYIKSVVPDAKTTEIIEE